MARGGRALVERHEHLALVLGAGDARLEARGLAGGEGGGGGERVAAAQDDLAEELAARVRDADEEEGERRADRGVDAVLDSREDGDEDRGEPDDELERRDAPVGVDLRGRGDEVGDGVDDDRRECSRWDPEECGSKT